MDDNLAAEVVAAVVFPEENPEVEDMEIQENHDKDDTKAVAVTVHAGTSTSTGTEDAGPYPLPPNFDELIFRMMLGENLLAEPFQRGDGRSQQQKIGNKGSKVSPCVQTKLIKVESEMARLAKEAQTLRSVKRKIHKVNSIMEEDVKYLMYGMNFMTNIEHFFRTNSTGIYDALLDLDNELLRQHDIAANLRLD